MKKILFSLVLLLGALFTSSFVSAAADL